MSYKNISIIVLLGTIMELSFFWANEKSTFIASIFGVVILILSVLFFKEKNSLLLFVFLAPNQRIITMLDSTTSLLNVILIYLFFCIVVTFRSLHLSPRRLILWSLPIIYAFCISFYTGSFFNAIVAVKAMFLIIIFWYFIYTRSKNIEFENIATMFIFGCIVASLIGLTLGDFGIGQRFDGGDKNNANILGGALSFALGCISLLVTSGKWKAMTGIPAALIVIVSGLLTQSRSFLLCLVIIIVFTIAHLLGTKSHKGKLYNVVRVFLILAGIVVFTKSAYLADILNAALSRVIEPRGDDISGGRLLLWAVYYNYLVSSMDILFFGIGTELAMDRVGVDQVAHNAILETLIGWGLVGFSMITMSLMNVAREVYLVKISRGFSSLGWAGSLPIIVLLTTSMTGHSFLSIGFITSLFIGSLALCFQQTKIDAAETSMPRSR